VSEPGVEELLRRAAAGDESAWNDLVERYTRLVWSVVRAHGLHGEVAADVHSTTFLRLVENLERIRNPAGLASWMATTARHECYRVTRVRGRETIEEPDENISSPEIEPADRVARADRDSELWSAVATLPERGQRLLRLLYTDPPMDYAEISAILDIPVGSIGPTRARMLGKLKEELSRRGITDR
jgi:RNA polymerase sigma factor (sigma-70 family)